MNYLRLLIGVAAIPVIACYTLAVVSQQQPAQQEAVSAVSAPAPAPVQPAGADSGPVEPQQ